jgi:DNA-binding PadR family transcriptional regulator
LKTDFHLTQLQEIILWTARDYKRSTNELAQAAEEVTGLPASVGTLYPYLKKLERLGLLEVHWPDHNPRQEGRPRLYYLTSPGGRELLNRLLEQKQQLSSWQAQESQT